MSKRYFPGILALMLIAIAALMYGWARSRSGHGYYFVARWVRSHRLRNPPDRLTRNSMPAMPRARALGSVPPELPNVVVVLIDDMLVGNSVTDQYAEPGKISRPD
jgi:hypothetical protein